MKYGTLTIGLKYIKSDRNVKINLQSQQEIIIFYQFRKTQVHKYKQGYRNFKTKQPRFDIVDMQRRNTAQFAY